MNDLVAKLKLDSKNWDNNISKARRSVKDLESSSNGSFGKIGGTIGKVGSSLSKFAGFIGLGITAMETLQKAVNSSSQLQDLYNDTIETSSKVTEQFFQSLTSGNWDRFNGGFLNAIKNARDYAREYRNVIRMLQVTSSEYEELDAAKTELEAIIEDDSRPIEERKKANEELQRILSEGRAEIERASRIANESLVNQLNTDIGKQSQYITSDNAKQFVRGLRNEYSDLSKELNEYIALREKATVKPNYNFTMTGLEAYRIQQQYATQFYQKYTPEQRAYYEELDALNQAITDETYQRYEEMFDRISQLRNQAAQWRKDATGAADEIRDSVEELGKAASSTQSVLSEEILPEGSIASIEDKISDLKEAYNKAANDGTRAGLLKAIEEAERELQMMLERAKGTDVLSPSDGIGNKPSYKNPMADIDSFNLPELKPFKPNKEDIEANWELSDSLGSIVGVMDSLNGVMGEGASGWIRYATNLITAVSTALPILRTLTEGLKAKAMAEAMGSNAGIGPFGWLQGIAAMASILAAFASLPKFASGGIVEGNSIVGDKVLARVNSGEMILNKSQQKNLFNMISGDNSRYGMNGKVEFVIEGKNLKGVLNNYNSKLAKY